MPTYHLLIGTDIKHKTTELNDYLYSREIFINSSFELTYKIKNIGNEKFPGGKIDRIEMSVLSRARYLYWSFDPPLEIPEILKGASVTKSHSLRLFCEPLVFNFVFQISLDKEGKILYFKDPSEEGESERYTSRFYVAVHRRQVEIVALLHQILSNLKKE